MKIISWNCCGKFREKFKEIIKYNADIYVIQECEDPSQSKNEQYTFFSKNHLWIGDNKNKGLGVFCNESIKLEAKDWQSHSLRYFLPVTINDKVNLICVWACKPYIEEYFIYQSININRYDSNTIIIGDFNSNSIWDKKNSNRTHTAVVNELEKIRLRSIYHLKSCENQGQESEKTFYLYRNLEKGYHIDHCFAFPDIVRDYKILSDTKWLNYSDHIPIYLEI